MLQVRRLGVVPYEQAWEVQERAAKALREEDGAREVVFVLQHPPVITLGRHADAAHVVLDEQELARRGVSVVATDRGGDVTVHAPGQIVLYLVLHLVRRRLGPARLVELLEEAMIETCRPFGVAAVRLPPHPGVWVGGPDRHPPRKLGAIGLRISGGVSTHGIALNVGNDLSLFEAVVPCGLRDYGVTSLAAEAGHDVDLAAVEDALLWAVQSELEETEALRPPPARRVASPARRGALG
jgi:lipoyl(octanoyl) transferase